MHRNRSTKVLYCIEIMAARAAAPATTAVCICGELRAAVCHARGQPAEKPLLTIARLVKTLGATRFDVFSVFDTPRTQARAPDQIGDRETRACRKKSLPHPLTL